MRAAASAIESTTVEAKTRASVDVASPIKSAEPTPATATEAVAVEVGRVGKVVRAGVKAVAIVGAVYDVGKRTCQVYEVEQQFQRGEISDHDRVAAHVRNGAGMAGGWGGAAAGAACGSVLGPVGSVVGGVGGYLGGEKLAEVAVDSGADYVYSGVDAARNAAGWTGGQLQGVAGSAKETWTTTWSRFGW